MSAILWEWLDMAVRWLHVIAGIAWIGSSFYFVHLDSSLRKREGLPAGAGGDAWQVHGGGFYHMVKYLVAPARMPDELTWFKWEAYATWLSGFALLVIVYYFGAELYLIDRNVMDLPVWGAVALSIAGLAVGWLAYDGLCRSPLGRSDNALAAAGFVFLVALSWLFTLLFSGRGAYMQMGALIGTMMVANVFLVIIPNQRKVVADLMAGRQPAAILGQQAKQRSMHNNYLTLPVLFVMISNHYPLAFASRWNWLILAVVLVVGAVIRHFYNTRHKGLPSPWWTWAVAAAGAVVIVLLSMAPPADEEQAAAPAGPVTFAQAEEVVLSRCSMCHMAEPVWEGVRVAPKGVMLDTPERIRLHAGDIRLQAVLTHAMPPGNVTEIPPGERAILAAWIENGARVE
ncbi:urate hydroxylase PuuD [Marinimicrococcus flavescens]|uniref:Urate hydroxylase PuuD n=1 Tax=Marinimicrococcus flavescens TaxID=3031815 RepID=A0AAP3UYA8_9PROT|nr:urate hydroxylase PuuD [Marinimicrococcus flavescens]